VILCQSPRRSWLALTRTLQGSFRPRGTRVRFLISVSPSICILAHICIIRLRAGIKRTFAILIFGQYSAIHVLACGNVSRITYRGAALPIRFDEHLPSDFIYFCKIHGAFIRMMFNCEKKKEKNPARGGFLARYFFFVSFCFSFFSFFFFFFFNYRERRSILFARDILRHVAVRMRRRALPARYRFSLLLLLLVSFFFFFFIPLRTDRPRAEKRESRVRPSLNGTRVESPLRAYLFFRFITAYLSDRSWASFLEL